MALITDGENTEELKTSVLMATTNRLGPCMNNY